MNPEQAESEIKALPIPNQWKLWRWRPKDRKSFMFGLGFFALAFVMIMARVDVGQQREAAQHAIRAGGNGPT